MTDTCKQFNKVIRKFYYFSYGKTAYFTKEGTCNDIIYFREGKTKNLHVVKETTHKSFNIRSIWNKDYNCHQIKKKSHLENILSLPLNYICLGIKSLLLLLFLLLACSAETKQQRMSLVISF